MSENVLAGGSLGLVFKDSGPTVPLVFVLSPGADPLNSLEKYAESKKKHVIVMMCIIQVMITYTTNMLAINAFIQMVIFIKLVRLDDS